MSNSILTIKKGSTATWSIHIAQDKIKYVPITSISNTAPIRLIASGHGLLSGSYFWVTGAKGLTEINAKTSPASIKDMLCADVIDVNTIEINAINATQYGVYTLGGFIEYKIPMDLTGCSVRGHVRKTEKAEEILLDLGLYATIDVMKSKINFNIPESVTSALVGTGGIYDIELIDSLGNVKSLPKEKVVFDAEVTRNV